MRVCAVATGRVKLPGAGDALELLLAPLLEWEPGARHEISDGARDHHFAGARRGGDAGADVDRDSRQLPLVQFAFADVNTDPRVEAEAVESFDDRLTRADRARGAVERREEAIASRVALLAAEPAQLPSHERMVLCEQVAPGSVTELRPRVLWMRRDR